MEQKTAHRLRISKTKIFKSLTGMRIINEKMLVTVFTPWRSCSEIIRGWIRGYRVFFFVFTLCPNQEWDSPPRGKRGFDRSVEDKSLSCFLARQPGDQRSHSISTASSWAVTLRKNLSVYTFLLILLLDMVGQRDYAMLSPKLAIIITLSVCQSLSSFILEVKT